MARKTGAGEDRRAPCLSSLPARRLFLCPAADTERKPRWTENKRQAAVAELTEDLKGAEAIFAVDYRGISVTEAAELRGKLREADAVFKVVKNRLAKRATADAGTTELDDLLVGPTALTLIKGDAVIAAKAIADFAKEHEELEYKGGIMDGAALDPEGFQVIARLPGVDVLHGQLVGLAASPLTGLVAGLSNMISGLGRQLAPDGRAGPGHRRGAGARRGRAAGRGTRRRRGGTGRGKQ